MAVGVSPCLVNSSRISHLGINPVRGGRPPKDRRIRGVMVARMGIFAHAVARELMVVVSFSLKTRKVVNVIRKYVRRVSRVREGENCRIRIIQPRCAMEEYARIFRSWVWFRPPQPPTSVERIPRVIRRGELVGWIWRRRAKGASFCHVERMRPVVRLSPCSTSGSQRCMGARPILRANARVVIVVGRGWDICRISHCPVSQALVMLANRSMAVAVAWARKYLVAASIARGW